MVKSAIALVSLNLQSAIACLERSLRISEPDWVCAIAH
jgi:hypothetical protein